MVNKKKIVSLCLAALLGVLTVMPVCAAGSEKKWTIGYDENTNGPEKAVQGTNGWYFMYSEDLNTDGNLDTSKLKECVWATQGSCWVWYEFEEMWIPDIFASDDYNCQTTSCWWRMDGNGIMDPNTTDGPVRSVIAWEAPESGTYSINIDYTAGSQSFDWEGKTYYNGSGLILSLNTDTDIVDKAFCESATKESPDVPTGTLSGEVTLKKGERIYVSADPGEDGKSDVAEIKMDIVQTEGGSALDLSSVQIVGIAVIVILLIAIVLVIRKGKKEELEEQE